MLPVVQGPRHPHTLTLLHTPEQAAASHSLPSVSVTTLTCPFPHAPRHTYAGNSRGVNSPRSYTQLCQSGGGLLLTHSSTCSSSSGGGDTRCLNTPAYDKTRSSSLLWSVTPFPRGTTKQCSPGRHLHVAALLGSFHVLLVYK